jgi:enamine deaminase RidA (YjgF/YER057c/UK114 family)
MRQSDLPVSGPPTPPKSDSLRPTSCLGMGHREVVGGGARGDSSSCRTECHRLGPVISERLVELGITLPAVFPPAGNYLGCVIDDGLVYVGGHGPIDAAKVVHGKVGGDLTLEDGYQAARLTALSILATLQEELGDLDRIARIVKVFGMVNVAPGFNQTPAVIDGCSDLLLDVFGEAGRHTRSAVGLAELPFDIAVEIELIARLRAE